MSKFFIADPLHINKRNFGSFYEYLEEAKANAIFNEERQDWLSLFGDYSEHQQFLIEEYAHLRSLTQDELFELSVLEVNIFKVSRAEILSLLITKEKFSNKPLPTSHRALFDYIFDLEPNVLLWNMAAAIQWINYWSPLIKQHNPKFVLVFSGSLIYARSLLELVKNRAPRAFVLESFFTGSDNYIEEKYEPIANNSNLKFKAYYRSLGSDESPFERDRSRNKAINKILSAANKNVTQPPENTSRLFSNGRKTVLITGQVLNDFSLLEYKDLGLNSLFFYKKIIQKILDETEFNVIFKAHPWERKKKNITTSLTLDALSAHFEANEKNYSHNERLLFLENYNIKSIFKQTDYVLGLNSQALLEAAFEGFQPVQFANAFYGKLGFTSDYSPDSIDEFIKDLVSEKIPSKLGLVQYRSYEEFITKALQFSLVSAFPSGKAMLKTIFHITPPISLIKSESQKNEPTVSIAKTSHPMKTLQPSGKPEPTVVQVDKKTAHHKRGKKMEKFLKTPKKFFQDSKNPRIKWLHVFFPKSAAK
jgi:hypothetical protein